MSFYHWLGEAGERYRRKGPVSNAAVRRCGVMAAEMFGVDTDDLFSAKRTGPVNNARHVGMAAARMKGASLPQIGGIFDRHHTSVLHAFRRVTSRPQLEAKAIEIEGMLG